MITKFQDWNKESFFEEKGLVCGLFEKLIPTAVSKIISINFLDIKTLDDKNIYNIEKKPTINLCDSYAQHYLDNGFPRELMINPPDILEGTRKLEMHKKLLNKNYVPKTVFSIEDAKKHLKFPIIIKASHSHSAQGVFKVDSIEDIEKTYKEIEKLNKKTKKDESLIPDVFSETINIAKEWRTILYKYKNGDMYCIYLAERIPKGDKIKSLRESYIGLPNNDLTFLDKKDPIENFDWELQDLNSNKVKQILKYSDNIIKDCFNLNPDVKTMAVDFCLDDKGKYWYIECNAHPGISYYLGVSYFYHIVKDFYGNELLKKDSYSFRKLIEYSKKSNIHTNALYPNYKIPEFEPDIIGKKL